MLLFGRKRVQVIHSIQQVTSEGEQIEVKTSSTSRIYQSKVFEAILLTSFICLSPPLTCLVRLRPPPSPPAGIGVACT